MKRPYKLIQTFCEYQKINKDATLTLIGGGEDLQAIKEYIKKHRVKKVRALGYKKYNTIPKYFDKSNYYIIASVTEGFPLTLLEAMSTGLPCITSGLPIFKQISKESKTGVVVDFEKPKEAAKQMHQYINSIDYTKETKKIAKFIRQDYTWENITKQYEKIFKQVIR